MIRLKACINLLPPLALALLWVGATREWNAPPIREAGMRARLRPVAAAPSNSVPVTLHERIRTADHDSIPDAAAERRSGLWEVRDESRGAGGVASSLRPTMPVPPSRRRPRERQNWLSLDDDDEDDAAAGLSSWSGDSGWLSDNIRTLHEAAERRRGSGREPTADDELPGRDLLYPDEFQAIPMPRNPLLED